MSDQIKGSAGYVLLSGILIIISLSVIMIFGGNPAPAEFPNAPGFNSAIYWFELIHTPEEVFQVLGRPGTEIGQVLRDSIDKINKYDYLFMLFYSIFYASLFYMLYLIANKNKIILYSGLILCVVMLIGDAYENILLFKLSSYGSIEEIQAGTVFSLKIWTRIKWTAIFISSMLASYNYIIYFGRSAALILPVLYIICSVIGLISISVFDLRFFLEFSSNLLGLCWLISIIHSGYIYYRHEKK